MPKLYKLIVDIVIGLIGYEVYQFLFKEGPQLPLSVSQVGELLIFIAVAIASTFFSGLTIGSSSSREQGTVKWFNARKGYGFITRDQGDDIFVHFRNIDGQGRKAIHEGERVSFVVTNSDKGLQADIVKIA